VYIAYLESAPATIADCSTAGLAVLGGYLALSAPTAEQRTLKHFYVAAFVALAIVCVGANMWQRNIEAGKQAILQQNETDARNQFSTDLADVKQSNEAILNFVAHPPQGFTRAQVVSVVQTFLNKQQTQKPSIDITNELRALTMVSQVVADLREQAQWTLKSKLQDLSNREWQERLRYQQQHQGDEQGLAKIDEQWESDKRKAEDIYGQEGQKRLISTADFIRQTLLQNIPPTRQFPVDIAEAQKFATAMSNPESFDKGDAANYLESLAKRVPPPTVPPSPK
jgi:hypothetical protein